MARRSTAWYGVQCKPVELCGLDILPVCCHVLLQATLLTFSSSEQVPAASVDVFTQFYSHHFYIYRSAEFG
jgi:hypothetical protein